MSRPVHKGGFTLTCLVVLAGCSPGALSGTQTQWDPGTPPPSTDSDSSPAEVDEQPDAPGSDAPGEEDPGQPDPDPIDDGNVQDAGSDAPDIDGGVALPEDPVPVEPEDPAFLGDEVCSTNSFWTGGNEESPLMRPGYACVDCHREEDEGPIYSIAGTIYLTGHEPDDCNGVNGRGGAVQVEIEDSAGNVVLLPVNAAGNFFSTARFTFPVLTKVIYEGRERFMDGEITAQDGDCNTCHTSEGREDAPGRIALP